MNDKSNNESNDELPAEPSSTKGEPTIHLDQFLKTCGVPTGGQAKLLIQGGEVLVNDKIETRRRRQLRHGDEVTLGEEVYVVAFDEESLRGASRSCHPGNVILNVAQRSEGSRPCRLRPEARLF